jgi:hypothetical protein
LAELVEDVAAQGEGPGDSEEAGFEGDAEAGEEVAAGDEPAAVGVGCGVGAGSDRHRHYCGLEGGAAEEFDDRGADAGGVDDQGSVRARRVAGLDGPARFADERAGEAGGGAGGGGGHGGRDARDEGEIGQAERVTDGRAEDEAEFGEGLVGDGIGAAEGDGEAFEEDEGGGVAAAAEVEAEEEMRLGVRARGQERFVEKGSQGMAPGWSVGQGVGQGRGRFWRFSEKFHETRGLRGCRKRGSGVTGVCCGAGVW